MRAVHHLGRRGVIPDVIARVHQMLGDERVAMTRHASMAPEVDASGA